MEALSLYELNNLVRSRLELAFPDEYWVQAELSDVRSNASGHCYLELIEKDARGNNLIAKARGMIWSPVYRLLKPYFEQETGQAFVSGIKVLVKVTVSFHELYGYSLNIVDIDPSYTLGDMARRRREILAQLEEEGVLTLNKELEMPLLPQRVAVISSAMAAGYGDFCNQLENNPYGYVFYPRLFPAMMQGERVEASVIAALDRIYARTEAWDAVVIIRGGGATSDLSSFDSYLLAANCAQFPLPIITGIGHERDDTVVDAVAHTRVKTPTAAAEYLIARVHESARLVESSGERLRRGALSLLEREKQRMAQCSSRLPALFANYKLREERRLDRCSHRLRAAVKSGLLEERYRLEKWAQRIPWLTASRIDRERHRLQLLEQRTQALSPERLLARGYSITLLDGRAVTDPSQVAAGVRLVTRVAKGEITSVVEQPSGGTQTETQV